MATAPSGHAAPPTPAIMEHPVTQYARIILAALPLLILQSIAQRSAVAADTMTLRADLTEAPRGLIRGKLTIPVKPGKLTLVYPQWIPGYHSPSGPVTDIAGLKFTVAGQPVPWRRDLVDMYAIHVDVPAGAAK